MSFSRCVVKNTGLDWDASHVPEHTRSNGTSGYEAGLSASVGHEAGGLLRGSSSTALCLHRNWASNSTFTGGFAVSDPYCCPYSIRARFNDRVYDALRSGFPWIAYRLV